MENTNQLFVKHGLSKLTTVHVIQKKFEDVALNSKNVNGILVNLSHPPREHSLEIRTTRRQDSTVAAEAGLSHTQLDVTKLALSAQAVKSIQEILGVVPVAISLIVFADGCCHDDSNH